MKYLPFLPIFAAVCASKWYDGVEPDLGRTCGPNEKGEEPGIRYFFDHRRNDNYPFYYKGCGGDDNRHTQPNGWISDTAICPGEGYGRSCHQTKDCEEGSWCEDSGWGSGYCCSIAIKERYEKGRLASNCPSGTSPKKYDENIRTDWGNPKRIFFGKNCTHNFCGTDLCIQEEFEAYCCE